jgi:hypothetical protein
LHRERFEILLHAEWTKDIRIADVSILAELSLGQSSAGPHSGERRGGIVRRIGNAATADQRNSYEQLVRSI